MLERIIGYLITVPFNPATGDTTNYLLYIILGAGALLIIAGLVVWLIIANKKAKKEPAEEAPSEQKDGE